MSYISPIKLEEIPQMEEGWADKIGKYIAGEVDNLVLKSCVKVGCHVDKDELEKALRYDRDQYAKGYADGKRDAADAIEELQDTVQAQDKALKECARQLAEMGPKYGEWIWDNYHWHCSECGENPTKGTGYVQSRAELFRYCPNCGVKMGVQE